jgi:hypothetical protein
LSPTTDKDNNGLSKEDRKVPFQELPLWHIYPLPHFLSQQPHERIIFQLTRGEKRGEQLHNRRASRLFSAANDDSPSHFKVMKTTK